MYLSLRYSGCHKALLTYCTFDIKTLFIWDCNRLRHQIPRFIGRGRFLNFVFVVVENRLILARGCQEISPDFVSIPWYGINSAGTSSRFSTAHKNLVRKLQAFLKPVLESPAHRLYDGITCWLVSSSLLVNYFILKKNENHHTFCMAEVH